MKGNQVRVGISAPKSVAVHREEIYNRIKAEESKPHLEVTCERGTAGRRDESCQLIP